ncbi:alpha/beta hydrolase [Gracilibacillus sp. S3-1-1]|uniref:Alpha/beta hydrolase n=1 Tax=Gracilibacillus pellucidus TaxID=3095368 RepID=A0ACC6M4B7_9BACI|nr:alpha/beta hydrolase [Gracilibacillus sp. S3-1-1]MDX8045746.1 alpha/beta hydrolase [Gracilibacillus sp. S3-1-1]
MTTIYKSKGGKQVLHDKYEKYLNTLLFDVGREYVETRFGETHVLVAGPEDGQPVFVFQGGNCINPMTLSWFSSLAKRYRIYAPDTIGHPGLSAETRISAEDQSFPQWIEDVMEHYHIQKCAFVGPSYGGGIILRLATFMPEKIACAVLVAPAGINLGSKRRMIKDVLYPLICFRITSSKKHLKKMTNAMSDNMMKDIDSELIGDVMKYVKLEQNMPKLTNKEELANYRAPTLIIAGQKDIFFPESKIHDKAKEIIPNLVAFKSYDMSHFPSEEYLVKMNKEIRMFLDKYYEESEIMHRNRVNSL